jgi:hypothetical protein
MKGERNPGAPKPKPNSPEPAGIEVFPGTYKVVISQGKHADSTMLTVRPDPRINFSKEEYDAKKQLLDRLDKSRARLTDAVDRLTEAEEIIKKIEAQLKDVEGKEADSLRKASKAMTDSIKTIREFIFGKRQEKQGYGTPPQVTPTNKLGEARNGVAGKRKMPDQQELRIISEAETLTDEAVKKVNAFFDTKWKDYRKQAEATPMKLFKDYTPLQ